MARCLLDSDVIIWFLRGRSEVQRWIRELSDGGPLFCSSLSVLEVAVGARPPEEAATREFLSSLSVVAPSGDVAWRAGTMMRNYARTGVTLDLVDAVIAATCIEHGLLLATFNTRHYPMPEIRFAPPVGPVQQ